jgi:hypothetical protein
MDSNTQDIVIPEPIRQFLNDLINRAGLAPETPELQYTAIEQLYIALNNYLLSVAIEQLPKSEMDNFASFASTKPSAAEMSTYLRDRIENADEVFTDAMEQFESIYLAGAKQGVNSATKEPK